MSNQLLFPLGPGLLGPCGWPCSRLRVLLSCHALWDPFLVPSEGTAATQGVSPQEVAEVPTEQMEAPDIFRPWPGRACQTRIPLPCLLDSIAHCCLHMEELDSQGGIQPKVTFMGTEASVRLLGVKVSGLSERGCSGEVPGAEWKALDWGQGGAQWQSTCLKCSAPWVPSTAPQKPNNTPPKEPTQPKKIKTRKNKALHSSLGLGDCAALPGDEI